MKLSIVVPCYKEEQALPIFYDEVTKVLKTVNCDYEFVLVDDGSADSTLKVMKSLSSMDENVHYLSFSRNFGKESAMLAGLTYATGDRVAIMDADLQDPPELIPQMMKILDDGEYDIVAARRSTREGEPKIRSFFAKKFYQIINKVSDTEIVDGARDFRIMTRPVVDAILSLKEANRFSKGIFGWVGFNTYWVSYPNKDRIAGETKWSFWSLFKYAIDGIINFSQVPLMLSSWFGIFMTGISFCMLLYVFIKKLLFGNPVAGWASTACLILFVGGLQLFFIGIVGQYIARIFVETKGRPQYIIKESNIK